MLRLLCWNTWRRFAAVALLTLHPCTKAFADSRPSILLFVYDTVRADAVSGDGEKRSVTPELDRLAVGGLRYTNAYANAPWTLPSHVSLFTGLLMHEHQVGQRGVRLPDTLVTLAERLRAVGYETVAFSENPFVTETFNMMQGFEHFENHLRTRHIADIRQPQDGEYNIRALVEAWLRGRSDKRPFFLFINVLRAHAPYAVTKWNQALPPGITMEAAAKVDQNVNQRICERLPPTGEIEILRSLYRDGVAADDAMLKAVRDTLRTGGIGDDYITIATSDHGEHFGEHRLMEHNFSVRNELLHVPLIVAGLPGVKAAVLDQPVQLADIVPSVLRWVGEAAPAELSGSPLPMLATDLRAPRSITAQYIEPDNIVVAGDEPDWLLRAKEGTNVTRAVCKPEDRVYGDMQSLLRYPFKLVWFERYPVQIYDLSKDPGERVDLSTKRPDLVKSMRAEIDTIGAHARKTTSRPVNVPPEVQERLRALGYGGAPKGKAPAGTPPP